MNLVSLILIRKAVQRNDSKNNLSFLVGMYSNYRVVLGYLISFCCLFIWIFALREINLSTATIIASSSYVLIVFIDKFFFNEEIKIRNLIGVFFISIGIILDIINNE